MRTFQLALLAASAYGVHVSSYNQLESEGPAQVYATKRIRIDEEPVDLRAGWVDAAGQDRVLGDRSVGPDDMPRPFECFFYPQQGYQGGGLRYVARDQDFVPEEIWAGDDETMMKLRSWKCGGLVRFEMYSSLTESWGSHGPWMMESVDPMLPKADEVSVFYKKDLIIPMAQTFRGMYCEAASLAFYTSFHDITDIRANSRDQFRSMLVTPGYSVVTVPQPITNDMLHPTETWKQVINGEAYEWSRVLVPKLKQAGAVQYSSKDWGCKNLRNDDDVKGLLICADKCAGGPLTMCCMISPTQGN